MDSPREDKPMKATDLALPDTPATAAVDSSPDTTKEGRKMRVQDIEVSKSDHYLAIATFTLIGITQLLIWNMVLNFSVSMSTAIWPDNVSLDLLGGTEHAAALLVSIVMLKFDGLQINHCHVWGVLNVLLFILFPLIPQCFSGNENYGTARALLITICGLLGFCSGFLHVFGYAFASICPSNYCGYLSTGNGVGGVFSFAMFTIFSEAVFDQTSVDQQVTLGWVFFILGAALSVVQVVMFYILSQKPWFRECIVLAKAQKQEDAEKALEEWGPARPISQIFKACWVQAFNAGLTFFVTLFMFPVVGPFGWGQSYTVTSLLNGTFQVVDLITRFLPVLGGWTRIPKKYLWMCVLARPLIFLPLFMIPNRFPDATFISSTGWLFVVMIVFTCTNGWLVTLATIYTPEAVENPAEKEIAAEIFVITILTMITAGIYASKLPLL